MLTTTDNPFSPVTQFNEWYAYDTSKGYNSLGLLARLALVSDSLSDEDNAYIIEEAIREIVEENVSGMHTSIPIPS